MKYLIVAVMLMVNISLFAQEYEIAKHISCAYQNVEEVVNKLKENKRNKNMEIEQVGKSGLFDIYWIEVIEINIKS